MDPNPSNVIENWCLIDGCYTFTVYDDYGDGMNGANPEYACGQNGDYTIYGDNGEILVELTSPNSDFGNQITHNFCVESDAPQASWRCINFECVDPLDGSGQYSSFNDCIAQCSPPSSINETNTEELIAFPNPFDQKITLISEENGTVNVYNILSQLVVSQTKENNKLELNLSNLENGIYFVELNNKLIKIIKE